MSINFSIVIKIWRLLTYFVPVPLLIVYFSLIWTKQSEQVRVYPNPIDLPSHVHPRVCRLFANDFLEL